MPTVRLGNPAAIDHATGFTVEGPRITIAHPRDELTLAQQVAAVTFDDGGPHVGLWAKHSAAAAPSWVESDSPALAEALARHYGCPIGEPNPTPEQP